ncbi:hypothetical protein [Halococcus qingdaonensis]|uniref:hypothetical protein n=1 Tax=Halococcus qingdaonensis TaxID=224402 RepID=UPI002116D000|nr:hypothetical protein [Halococcus qingdaonensis]
MLGSTAAMKAAKKGYKRYGIPGALAAGGGAILGIRFVKRRFLSGTGENDTGDGAETTDEQ